MSNLTSSPRLQTGSQTYWGKAQWVDQLAPNLDVYRVSTAGHGGFKVYQTAWAKCKLPKEVIKLLKKQGDGGWYEEDAAWCFVAFAFPLYFSDKHMIAAGQTCAMYYPEVFKQLQKMNAIGEY